MLEYPAVTLHASPAVMSFHLPPPFFSPGTVPTGATFIRKQHYFSYQYSERL